MPNVQLLLVLAISQSKLPAFSMLLAVILTYLFVRIAHCVPLIKTLSMFLVDEMAKSGPTLHMHANATEVVKKCRRFSDY